MFEVSLADLQNDEVAFRKFKLITEDVQGKNCLTNFHGMDLTRDKMCSMVKKWQVKQPSIYNGYSWLSAKLKIQSWWFVVFELQLGDIDLKIIFVCPCCGSHLALPW